VGGVKSKSYICFALRARGGEPINTFHMQNSINLTDIICFTIGIISLLFAGYVYLKNRQSQNEQKLREQIQDLREQEQELREEVVAFYCLEDVAIQRIMQHEPKTKYLNLKKNLRKAAAEHKSNTTHKRPNPSKFDINDVHIYQN